MDLARTNLVLKMAKIHDTLVVLRYMILVPNSANAPHCHSRCLLHFGRAEGGILAELRNVGQRLARTKNGATSILSKDGDPINEPQLRRGYRSTMVSF